MAGRQLLGLRARLGTDRGLAEVHGDIRVRLGRDDVVHPGVHAVRVLCLRRDHPGVGPARRAFLGLDELDLLAATGVDRVGLVLPGRADRHVAIREPIDLFLGSPPVLADQALLLDEQVLGRRELRRVECVGVLDPELGLRRHQVQRGVRDIDRVVVGRDLALVRRVRFEDGAPAVGLCRHDLRVVHQDIRAASVGHAVTDAVDRVVGLVLQAVEDVRVVRDQAEVDGSHVTAGDQTERRVARSRHAVILPGLHQLDHVGRVEAHLDRDLAAGRGLEGCDPVVALDLLAAGSADDIARPGNEVEGALGRPERRADAGRRLAGGLARRRLAGG